MKEIKVLHLFGDYLKPSEVWAYNLLKFLPNLEVHVAALHYLKNNFYDPTFHFTTNELDALIQYKNALDRRKPIEAFHKLIIKSLPYFLGSYDNKLIRYAHEQHIDVLHAHFGPTAWKYKKIAEKLNIPFVVSFYGYDYEHYPKLNPEYNAYYRRLFQLATMFFCEGKHGKTILIKKGCPEDKISISRLGIDIAEITFRKRDKQVAELNLIQVASFTEKKGHLYTLRAFLSALYKCPNMKLTLIGGVKDENIKKEVDDFIRENNLESKVRVLHFLPYDQVIEQLYQHQVFIHPSCYTQDLDCEGGAPIVLLDAQASGMPIISTRHCDIPAEVIHGETGYLVGERDVDGLEKAIIYFYNMNADTLGEYSVKARAHVVKEYDIRTNAARLAEIYRSLI